MKNSREAIALRQDKIIQQLQKNQTADVCTLAEQFGVTTTTIRRDLSLLESRGVVKRHYGGVKLALAPNVDVQYQTLVGNPTPQKESLAELVASMVSNGDIVFLNSSSTVVSILQYLNSISVNVITNNARALYIDRKPGVDLFLTGGEVYGNKQSLVGEFAVNSIKRVVADKCFLGASGISVAGGITSSIIQEVMVNQQMLEHCRGPKILVAESSKIGMNHSFFNFDVNAVTHLITDAAADPDELEKIRKMGVEVIIVNT